LWSGEWGARRIARELGQGKVLIRILSACAVCSITMAMALLLPATAGDLPQAFSISFDSEWVRLAVIGDSLEVHGTYYLRCRQRTGVSVSLFYPFPQDSLLGGARMVSLSASVGGITTSDLEWEENRSAPGVRWRTPPCIGDTIVIDAVYRQALTTSYARYIVTTTRAWQRPLRLARFEIRLPPGATPIEFSFPFEARADATGRYYGFESREFFPDRDVTVRWSRAQAE
jgi:hypothetical protein